MTNNGRKDIQMDGSKDTGVLASRQADESEGKHSE